MAGVEVCAEIGTEEEMPGEVPREAETARNIEEPEETQQCQRQRK